MDSRNPIHINEGMKLLDIARDSRQKVNIMAWDSKGNIIEYKGWLVSSRSWKKGFHRIMNPVNNQIRTVPDIFMFNINGHPISL